MKRLNLTIITLLLLFTAGLPWGIPQGQAAPVLNPNVDLSKPNYAYSPPLRKFINNLPGLGAPGCTVSNPPGTGTCNENNLGQYIPIAAPQTLAGFPNDDYYEIALVEYREQLHSDLPPVVGTKLAGTGGTKIRGYVQEINGVAVGAPQHLGPLIIATKNRPVRIKFTNRLPLTAAGGNLFIPVDATIMGAGEGPLTPAGAACDPATQVCANYTQNRATIHLHGGFPPWISDGTAHQWITPGGEATPYLKGASQQNVPDMAVPPAGSATFYWTNQQGGRLMFYHDHAYGLTRLNVYAGEAAGYLLVDPAEETALAAAGVPGTTADLGHLIPLVIQDRTFVYDNTVTPVGVPQDPTRFTAVTDPLWANSALTWGGAAPPPGGSFWYPHVYEPNQDPTSLSGANPLGRWDYGPWFWPVFPVASPYPPTVSHVPEAFMDTPVINGTAYPYLSVAPAKYRLRILNATNDRMLNLQLYQADTGYTTAATATATVDAIAGTVTAVALNTPGTGYAPNSSPMVHIVGGGGYGAWATATVNGTGGVASITLTNGGGGYTTAPAVTIGGSTEVKMVPAVPNAAIPFPPLWLSQTPGMTPDILDSRLSGVPDPTLRGPAMIQIGTEGGLLPAPVLLPNTPVGFEQNKRNIVVLNVLEKTLFMSPAERADVIVDFTNFAGKTVILYNDSPAPVPAGDPRYDFYTGNPDYSVTGGANNQGGAPSTPPGYGPNTRTLMQFRVTGSGGTAPVDNYPPALLASLNTNLPVIFATTQDKPVVPEPEYPAASGGNAATATYSSISANSLTFTPAGAATPVTMPLRPKTIQELFDTEGRMNATLGVELPFTNAGNQTTVPLGFADPTTETLKAGETQLWKITHNGVDTHGIHFHLVNVQVINRVGWDGAIRPTDPNELGWKETVRMNPLEDIIVAMRAKAPTFPFSVPNSIRPLNPTLPVGATFPSFDPLTGQPTTVTNAITNFGHEYTWHCHILGHEENDMMRPLVLLNGAKNDFNNDGKSDILWYNATTSQAAIWYLNGVNYVGSALINATSPAGSTIVDTGDFNNDGQPDILWFNSTTRQVNVWYMNVDGVTYTTAALVDAAPPAGWAIVGTDDFNSDGKSDIIWYNATTNQLAVWYMNGGNYDAAALINATAPVGWTIVGTGDFNSDSQPDILWYNPTTRQLAVWYMNGVNFSAAVLVNSAAPAGWTAVGISDFNSDRHPDILWYNSATRALAVWYMNGVNYSGAVLINNVAPVGWAVVGR